MKAHAQALNAALDDNQKGIPEADALLKQGESSSTRCRSSP